MTENTCFIEDRALSLSYEAVQFPTTAMTALAWLHRAMAWAEARGLTDLQETLNAHLRRVE